MYHIVASATSLSPVTPSNSLPQGSANTSTIKTVLGIVFGLAGALAFLMIVISGLRYILSAGDPQKASKAREGVIYALAGLAIAIAAEAIVNFVVGNV